MIEIEYHGGNNVVISTKRTRIVIDPNMMSNGIKKISLKDSVQLATEARFLFTESDADITIEGPGEYEVGSFSIKGIATQHHLDVADAPKRATIYRIEVEDIRIGIIGNIAEKISEEQQEALGVLDIIIIPVGGNGYTLDATSAAGLVRSIDVRTVIPIHYADSSITYEVPQDDLSVFTAELGRSVEETPKYKLRSSASLPQTPTVIVINRS